MQVTQPFSFLQDTLNISKLEVQLIKTNQFKMQNLLVSPESEHPSQDWVSCFSSTVSTAVRLFSKIHLILQPSELKPQSQTHPRYPKTMESPEVYYQSARMNTHTQSASNIKKKWNKQVGFFGLVAFYSASFFGVRVCRFFFPLQVRHKYCAHPSVVLEGLGCLFFFYLFVFKK